MNTTNFSHLPGRIGSFHLSFLIYSCSGDTSPHEFYLLTLVLMYVYILNIINNGRYIIEANNDCQFKKHIYRKKNLKKSNLKFFSSYD